MKKKILFGLMFFGLAFSSQAACTDTTGTGEQRIKQYLNFNDPSRNGTAQKAYNEITNYYSNITKGSCDLSVIANKLENIQKSLNINISNNFNGKNQIPFNERNPYTGHDVEIEVPTGKTGADGKPLYEKRKINAAIDGTDHTGLIKYVYAKSGVNVAGFNEMLIEDFAKLTKYQLQPNSPLKPGDIIVMNYNNDRTIDNIGLVYHDAATNTLKMLEMGGNSSKPGTSVKSGIPLTTTNSTAYVVPFETLMQNVYTSTEEDPKTKAEREKEIFDNMLLGGENINIPANNPAISNYSQPRPAGALKDNGSTITQSFSFENDPQTMAKTMTGAGKVVYETFSKGTAKVSRIILMLMTVTFSIQILWKIFRGGVLGNPNEIFHMIFSELVNKSPYFIFVIFYPLFMRQLIIPLFIEKLPTYLFGDFIKVGAISMENKRYITYLDIMAHIMKKGAKLVIATFGAGMTQQPESVKSLFGMFGTIFKTFSPTSYVGAGMLEIAQNLFNAYGTVNKIIYLVLQIILFRPISVITGLLTVITLFNLALNMFMCFLSFCISTSVGLFYMICGTWDVLKAKSLNTFSIMISGLIQYLVMLAFIIVMAETAELLGSKLLGTIMNPANFIFMIKIYLCISIVNSMCRQVGRQLATSF